MKDTKEEGRLCRSIPGGNFLSGESVSFVLHEKS